MNQDSRINLATSAVKNPRRSFLRLAAAAATGWIASLRTNLASATTAVEAKVDPSRALEGTWLEQARFLSLNLKPGERNTYPKFITCSRGNGLFAMACHMAPNRGNISSGAWKGDNPKEEFVLSHTSFIYDVKGGLEKIVKTRETITFQPDLESFDGVAAIDFVDERNVVLAHLDALTHGTRVHVAKE